MTRASAVLVAVFVGAAGVWTAARPSPQASQQPTFRAGANLVHVDVYPRRNGKIVDGLTTADFQVFEDGKPQTISALQFVRVQPELVPETSRRDPNNTRDMLAQAADPATRVFVMYLDTYHVNVLGGARARGALVQLLDKLLAPSDLFGVITPAQRASDLTLGRRMISVSDQLTKSWPWGERDSIQRDDVEAEYESCFGQTSGGQRLMIPDGAVMRWVPDVLVARRREDLVLSSLEELVRRVNDIREERKALLLVSDGWRLYGPDQGLANLALNGGPPEMVTGGGTLRIGGTARGGDVTWCNRQLIALANLDDQKHLRDIIDLARRSNVSFYPISPGGLQVFDTPLNEYVAPNPAAQPGASALTEDMDLVRDRVDSLQTIAANTDGIALVNTNDLNGNVGRIADDLSAYYVLGYYSTNTKLDGTYRKIEVKVKPAGITVAARHGYVAASPGAAARPEPTAADQAAARLRDDIAAALGNTARAGSSDIYTYGAERGGDLVVSVELADRLLMRDEWSKGATVQVVATEVGGDKLGTQTATIVPGARGAQVRFPRPPGPGGPWQMAVHVTGHGDALDDSVRIVEADVDLVGTPLFYRATPSGTSPLRPAAEISYRRTERAHIEWPLARALDQRSARLLDQRGQPLPIAVTLSERTEDGGAVLAADLVLGPLAPGEYVIELTAAGGGQNVRRLIGLHVTP